MTLRDELLALKPRPIRPNTEALSAAELQKELRELAATRRCKLPREFATLLATVGGRPFGFEGYVCCGGGRDAVMVSVMYGFDKGRGYDLHREGERQVEHGIPMNLLKIGEDPGGNQICLVIAGEGAGTIRYWDHETARTRKLAPGLAEFVKRLRRDESDT